MNYATNTFPFVFLGYGHAKNNNFQVTNRRVQILQKKDLKKQQQQKQILVIDHEICVEMKDKEERIINKIYQQNSF
jgi:hypothetical protein